MWLNIPGQLKKRTFPVPAMYFAYFGVIYSPPPPVLTDGENAVLFITCSFTPFLSLFVFLAPPAHPLCCHISVAVALLVYISFVILPLKKILLRPLLTQLLYSIGSRTDLLYK